MRRWSPWLLALAGLAGLAACDPARGPVTVTSFHDRFGVSEPTVGAKVVFADRDGEARVAYIDAQGRAEGEVEPGGSVWLAWYVAEQFGANAFAAYLDVEPGALAFGSPPPVVPAIVARMMVRGAPPSGDAVRVYSPCGRQDEGDRVLALDDRCAVAADVLAVAIDLDASGDRMLHYAWLPAQAVVDGGTITVAPADWHVVERVSIRLQVAGGLLATSTYLQLSNGLVEAYRPTQAGDTFTWALPLAGDELRLTGQVKRAAPGESAQHVEVRLPLVANQDLDLATVLAPWTVRDFAADAWSTDDAGGTLTADALVVVQTWDQPIANFVEANHLRLVSPPAPLGDFDVPDLPSPLSRHQPAADFRVLSTPHLLRVAERDRAHALRWAEQLTRRGAGGGSTATGELPTASVAITLGD